MSERELIRMSSSFKTVIFGKTYDLINIDFTKVPSGALREMARNNPDQLIILTDPDVGPIVASLVNLHDPCRRCGDGSFTNSGEEEGR